MKNLIKLLIVCVFISGLIFADDYYWSRGHKIQIIRQDNLAVIRDNGQSTKNADNSLAAALENVNAKIKKWPKEFNRANGKFRLIDANYTALKNHKVNDKYILPVFKDNTGELILPTENIIIGIKKNASKYQINKFAGTYGLKLKSYNSPMPGMAVLTVPADKSSEIIDIANKLKIDPETRWAHPDFIAPHYKRAQVSCIANKVKFDWSGLDGELFRNHKFIPNVWALISERLCAKRDQPYMAIAFRSTTTTKYNADDRHRLLHFAAPEHPKYNRQITPYLQYGTLVNDPLFNLQWHLTNDGSLASATIGADAKVAGAWNTTYGTSIVRVCIYDDAVEKNHEDLAPNFVAGLDLDTMGPDPSPKILDGQDAEIHGTACSGVAVARGNNGIGVSGAAPYCSLMGIRWGTVSSSDTAGFFWAKTNGADIISCSWGTYMNDALYEAIRDAAVNGRNGLGIPIFFAAGNANETISSTDPARHPNVICVTASNIQDDKADYSSFGDSASIAAPSNNTNPQMPGITTTDYMGSKGYSSDNYCRATDNTGFGGTSSATPLAAGVGALCLSVNTNLTYLNVKALLQETADKIASNNYPYINGWNQYLGYGRINAANAVAMAPGYTNTPSAHDFELSACKGRINIPKNKFKAKLQHDVNLGHFTNAVIVTLDGMKVAEFSGGEFNWKWNKKQTRGKNKNISKDLIKFITGRKGINTVIVKLKNISGVTLKPEITLRIQITGKNSGAAFLKPDSKGKFKQCKK